MTRRGTHSKLVRSSLRMVAERAGVAPSTVSAVLNSSEASWVITQSTKERVFQAARELNYRPNFAARYLRTNRTYTVAVIAPNMGMQHVASTLAGAEFFLRRQDYALVVVGFDPTQELASRLSAQLLHRGIEGVLAINVDAGFSKELPVVAVNYKHVDVQDPLSPAVRQWLEARGHAAARALVGQIEKQATKPVLIPEALQPTIDAQGAYAAD
jgi:DNA-binding LacI/PurR family transcriptional regulator